MLSKVKSTDLFCLCRFYALFLAVLPEANRRIQLSLIVHHMIHLRIPFRTAP